MFSFPSLQLDSLFLAATLQVVLSLLYHCLPKKKRPLPPGPPGWPLLGNVFDMPKQREWKVFAEWGRKWGDMVHVNLMGQSMIIVNSAKAMEDFDKKGSVYSDRPVLAFGGETVGYSKTIVLMRYGPRYRQFRKLITQLIGSFNAVQRYSDVIESETRRYLKRVFAAPDALGSNLRKLDGAIIMRLTYGIEVQDENDPFVALIEKANDNFSVATAPGAFLVDVFPLLRYIPEWCPGGGFKKLARKFASAFNDMVDMPFAQTRKLMRAGQAPTCFVSSSLGDETQETPDTIWNVRHCAASLYGAGADTTKSSQEAFYLAMILAPEVQKKAQAEIDTVIGSNRLPTLADRSNLPYLNAVVKELLRWHNVAPLGVPHAATEDGVINGYFIPKGSLVVANLWAMLHDPAVYPEPFTFDPTRFIEEPGRAVQRDPKHACFGFARRICPGMYLAEQSLWLCVAMSLAVFTITNAVENGVPVIPVHENTSGTISHPEPFKYKIRTRSSKAANLICGL